MSGPLGSSQWMYASGYEIDQSLRLNDDNVQTLSFTPATNGTSTDIFTVSFWCKRGKLGESQYLFDIAETTISFSATDFLTGNLRGTETGNYFWTTDAVFRDTSSWYHIVAAYDSTQGTDTNRFKLYVNGTLQTFSSISYMPQNREMKNTTTHYIGYEGSGYAFDGYFADYYMIDGQQLTAADFGETGGTYGEWKPIEYSGTFGTNGFYLPFKNDYTVEGFSTVVSKGNATVKYIGGVGFKPDLVWNATRSASQNRFLVDSLRGTGGAKELRSNLDNAEAVNDTIISFEPDGFMRGSSNDSNENGTTYVDWCWDMGGGSYGFAAPTITAESDTHHSTDQAKFGATSIEFDGTDDFLTIEHSMVGGKEMSGKGDFTVEMWVYPTSSHGWEAFATRGVSQGWAMQMRTNDANYALLTETNSQSTYWGFSWNLNAWNHIAAVFSPKGMRAYHNGSLANHTSGTRSYTAIASSGHAFQIGKFSVAGETNPDAFSGYMDEIRISNKDRYPTNFTPATSAFSNDEHTLLLIHSDTSNNSTTFVDSSGATQNTDGGINSYVMANTTYGQSMVAYTGTGSASTVGHGLDSAPDMVILKRRNSTEEWPVYHSGINSGWKMYLNNTAGEADDLNNETFGNLPSSITSTTFGVGTHARANANNSSYIAYCFHDVTGYSKFGSYAGSGSSGNKQTTGFAPGLVIIKIKNGGTGNWYAFDNVRTPGTVNKAIRLNTAEVEDSLSTNWSLTFLSDGFEFLGTGLNVSGDEYIYAAWADKREYAYWLDQSGNNNDFTSANLTESDISVDSPSNNFAVLNALDVESGQTLSEGNLKTVLPDNKNSIGSIFVSSGKWYWEVLNVNPGGVGIISEALAMAGKGDSNINGEAGAYNLSNFHGTIYYNSSTDTTVDAGNVGDIVGVALDLDNNKIYWHVNGEYISLSGGQQNPTTAANPINITQTAEAFAPNIGAFSTNPNFVANFGQDSSFAGNKTSQGNQDSGDIGDFFYEPPSGFLALCTSNLPEPAVTPSEHFNTVLYSGNDADDRSITGVGFQPDWVWLKSRSTALNHYLYDVLRGANYQLLTNVANGEANTADRMQAFESDGFQLGTSNEVNGSSRTYVAWNWKANGSGSANTTGSTNSTVSANTDAGFSIVTYTGSSGPDTIGHGLSKAPEIIIAKNRSVDNQEWLVYHANNTAAPETDYLRLDTTAATADNTFWNDTAPTSSVFSVGDSQPINSSHGNNYIAYCFHSVDGYSKVGSYTGNGNANGPFVYTGFKPAFVMLKPASRTGHWMITNNKSTTYNLVNKVIFANDATPEYTNPTAAVQIDYLSNGFKLRETDDNSNENAATYVFMAFAETPLKYANAR